MEPAPLASLDFRPRSATRSAGSATTAAVRHAISPRTAVAPKRKSARFFASSSDEYPMIVVSEQSPTAAPVDRTAPVTFPSPSCIDRVITLTA